MFIVVYGFRTFDIRRGTIIHREEHGLAIIRNNVFGIVRPEGCIHHNWRPAISVKIHDWSL